MKKRITTIITAIAAASALTVSASADFITSRSTSPTVALADAYEDGEAWIHMVNPYNESAMFTIEDVPADTKDVVVCFDISGCDGSYQAFAGFGINGWTPSIWSEDEYVASIGALPTFIIDHDGSYEMIVPFNLFLQTAVFTDEDTGEEMFKEYVEGIDCLELCIKDLSEDTTAVITITDIKPSSVAHTLAECASGSNNGGNSEDTSEPEQSDNNAVAASEPDGLNDKSTPDTGVEGVSALAGVALISFAAIAVSKKRKK